MPEPCPPPPPSRPPSLRLRPSSQPGLFALALAGLLSACMVVPPRVGTETTQVLRDWGEPTARYPQADGRLRLEYATGPYGRSTWMIDLDAGGRVVQARQVLSEPNLMAVQGRLPGMSREELLSTLGRPGERHSGGRQGGVIWSWRYETNECFWFRVGVGDDGRVGDGGFYPDPACDNRGNGLP